MNTLPPLFLIRSTSFLQVTSTCMKAWMSLNFSQIPTPNSRVICPCTSEKLMYNVVNTLVHTFSIQSSSFLQVTRTINKSKQSSNLGQIGLRAVELRPLIDVRNWFLLNILRMDGQNFTKFCIHIIIDKIYVVILKGLFLQICNRVTAFEWCQKLVFAQYLENGWTEFNQNLYTHYHR